MAQSTKSSAPPPPPPAHDEPPPAEHEVTVPGIPPRPDVHDEKSQEVSDQTKLEQDAGRETSSAHERRLQEEQEAGRKAVERNSK